MIEIEIIRDESFDNQTLGKCFIKKDGVVVFKAESIERGWLDNKVGVSCIPKGSYIVKLEYSNRFKKKLWEIKNVPNRSECKFHSANFARELNGCISLGEKRADLDKDVKFDVTNSKETMQMFHSVLSYYTEVNLIIS